MIVDPNCSLEKSLRKWIYQRIETILFILYIHVHLFCSKTYAWVLIYEWREVVSPNRISHRSPNAFAEVHSNCKTWFDRFILSEIKKVALLLWIHATFLRNLRRVGPQTKNPTNHKDLQGFSECPGLDLNQQGVAPTTTSTLRVCQFRHLGFQFFVFRQ